MRRTVAAIAIAVLLVALAPSPRASADGPDARRGPDARLIERLNPERLSYHSETGWVRFVGGSHSKPIWTTSGTADPLTAARAFLGTYGTLFGLKVPKEELRARPITDPVDGISVVRFDQVHQGIPVIAGELALQVDASGGVLAVSGEISPDLSLDVAPAITAEQAAAEAIRASAKANGVAASDLEVEEPTLAIYDPALLGGPGLRVPRLVWRTEVSTSDVVSVRDFVAVEAQTGGIALRFSEVENALERRICDHANVPGTTPCTDPYVRVEGGPPTGIADADAAYDYLGDTYTFYYSQVGRDSIDDAGMPLVATVRYCPSTGCPFNNAAWNGTQMVFGAGYVVDDVAGHELTHGVTDYTSNLFYYYQSGAINESISDIFGEFVDQTNGRGNDSPAVKWLLGEDLAGGAGRSMADPPVYWQPDRMQSSLYYSGTEDGGGVHYNSGIGNKAAYLLTDGGSFNEHAVGAIGLEKTARIFYVAETTLLTSGSDYADLYDDLQQACTASIGTAGISAPDCAQVGEAVAATEMNLQPVTGAAVPDAPVCPAGTTPVDLFFDSFEAGTSNWSGGTLYGSNVWGWLEDYASSGTHVLYGWDSSTRTDSYAAMTTGVTLPAGGSYLRFAHAYEFEPYDYDGGVVEYSVNGGTTWQDAGPLFVDNPYNGTIAAAYGNPLGGRPGFTRLSYGYTSSRLSLASLAGSAARFRFRIGTDSSTGAMGWLIDDVRIYTCFTPTAPGAPTGVTAVRGNASATVSWSAPASTGGSPITGYEVTAAPGGATCSTTGALSCAVSGLTNGTAYTFTVRASNAIGPGPASAPSAPVTPATVPGAPTGVSAVGANTAALVSWAAPADNGGDAITSYTVTSAPDGRTCSTTGSLSCAVTGLLNGTAYTFTVRAANGVGTGPTSDASAAVTPAPTVPGPPTGVVATPGNGMALVSWSAPADDGGFPINGYTATSSPDGATCATDGTLSCTVNGLTNGTSYTFTVTATNELGIGPASAPSVAVTPAIPPTASIMGLPLWLATNSVPLHWSATPGTLVVSSYDVRYRRAAWNGGFGGYTTWQSATTGTSATFSASSGYTYCFSVRARDTVGTLSAWTAETCTAIPLDDRSLSRSSGWTAGTSSTFYRSTYLRSYTYGAKLTRTGVVARRIAILARTCSTCGTVRVYWGSTLLRTISLKSATTVNKKLITVTTFTSARSGTLKIKVDSSGKKVIIDGVAIRRD